MSEEPTTGIAAVVAAVTAAEKSRQEAAGRVLAAEAEALGMRLGQPVRIIVAAGWAPPDDRPAS